MKKLNENFLNELFKICLKKKTVFELAHQFVKYNYLPSEHYKSIWQSMVKYYEGSEKLITTGLLSQEFSSNTEVIKIIADIKNADVVDEELAINQLEIYIKNMMFIDAYDQLGDLYNTNKKDEAFEVLYKMSEDLSDFHIKDHKKHNKIIGGFVDRLERRIDLQSQDVNARDKRKIPTGIKALDDACHGGIDKGDIGLILAQSGVGKSTALRWLGVHAARLGFVVVHIQAEGSQQEAEDLYDSAISGKPVYQVENAMFSDAELDKVGDALDHIEYSGGEIYIHAFEQFDAGTMRDVDEFAEEIKEKYGRVDLIIIDYLDEMEVGDGKRYSTSNEGERKRRSALSKKFKNICVKVDAAGWTATQSNTVDPSEWNDPSFVYTRYNISEFKGLVKPFSYFITLNQTEDELEEGVMRIYKDKWRKYKNNKKSDKIVHICTNYKYGRFYNHQKTMRKFH